MCIGLISLVGVGGSKTLLLHCRRIKKGLITVVVAAVSRVFFTGGATIHDMYVLARAYLVLLLHTSNTRRLDFLSRITLL